MLTPAGIGLAALGVLIAGLGLMHALGPARSLSDRFGAAGARLGFTIAQVVVEGRVKTPEPLLRAAIGATPGAPILDYRLDAARARIESINWVQAATVERRLPDTIVVKLVERRPFAVWQYEGKFRLIDRDGQVVTDSDVATFAGQLPLVVGAGAPAATAALMDALAQQPGIQARVMAAVRVGERRWNLRLKSGTDVLLPEGAETQALAKLAELQAQHALLDRPLQAIDMRLPDRFVFRPQPTPAAEPKDMPAAPPRRPT
ncbi:MAG: cell division protein FtsQ/DivIB [Alphaproteobacteria bacterium]|nr:cell division protein FtsQ/DivIB [Alphaproteobacteria bacterium]